MSSSSSSVTPGSTVAITVKSDSGSDLVNSVQAAINYDASQLQYVSMTNGTAFPNSAANSTGTAGVIRVARSTSTPVSGSNTVVVLNFKVLSSSGTASLSFDKNFSFVVSSTTNTDILSVTTGVNLTVAGSSSGSASMTLSPGTGTATAGSTVSVTLRENSGSSNVNAVQAAITYNASQLQYTGMTEGGTFTNSVATNTSTAGLVRVARSVQGGSVGVTGDNAIVTLSFKVLATSGTTSLALDKTQSFVVASSNNADILGTVAGSTFTINSSTPTGAATLSLSPSSGTYTNGSSIAVQVKATGSSLAVVQATLNYPASQLQFVSINEGTIYTNKQRTNTSTAGVVDITRSIEGGSDYVNGTNTVFTVNFKVIGSTGSAAITYGSTSAIYDGAGTGANVLNLGSSTGANFTVGSTSSPSPSPTPSGSPDLVVTDVTWSPATPATGNQVTYSATVKNQGDGATPSGTIIGVAFSVDGTVTNWSDTSTTSLGAGQTRTLTANSGPSGSSFWTATTGTHTILANVDDAKRITESNDTNNTLSKSMTVSSPIPTGSATLALTPSSGTYATGSTIPVIVKASSSTAKMTTIQATLNYPANQLQYVGITEGSVFTNVQRTNTATAGTLDIIRAVEGGQQGVVGTNPVVTVNFKVIGTSGTAAVGFGNTSAIYDFDNLGTNVLSLAGSTAANYTVGSNPSGCTANPSTPGTPTRSASTYTTATITWTASTPGSNCTLAGYHVYRDGTLVGDVTSGTTYTDSGLSAGESHSYTVKAFDTAGHNSATSSASTVASKADDMSPTTPIGFTAAAPDAVSVNLAWNPSTDFPNPGGIGVQGYKVYRNGSSTATYTVTSGTSFKDTNVTANTTYSYIITAFDKVGNESSPSNAVSAKTATGTVSCTGNPSTPTNLSNGTVTLSSVSLSWTASSAASGCTLSGYKVYRNGTFVGSATSTSYTDNGLTPGTSYSYTVQSYDSNGHTSAISTGKSVSTAADTSAPSAPSGVTANAVSAGQVSLAWQAATDNVAVTGYKVYRGTTVLATLAGTARSYNDTTVSAGSSYTYSLSALDAAGNESSRSTASPSPVTTPTASDTTKPTAPSNIRITATSTSSASFTWNASTDNVAVIGYHVYRAGIFIGDATGLSFSDINLSPSTTYLYTVKAFDAAGNNSDASSQLSVTTLQSSTCIRGDLDCNKIVDAYDLSTLLTHFGERNVPVKFGDIDQDGKVDSYDLSSLLSCLGDKG